MLETNKRAFELVHWKDIKVGHIVKIYDDQFAPADFLLLGSSDPKG